MSKLKRLLGALSLVALFIFSSCVDDEVAPEVAALRQAQVDLLNADAAYTAALTALKNADVAFRNAETAGELIANADAQADLDLLLVKNATIVAQQQTLLEVEALKLAEAQRDLARFLSTQGLEEAAYYLAQWEEVYFGDADIDFTASADTEFSAGIVGTRQKINKLEGDIARDELFLNENDSVTQAYIDATVTAALVSAQAELARRTELLVTKQAELDALLADDPNAAILVLEEALIAIQDDVAAAASAVTAAEKALDAAAAGPTSALQKTVDDFVAADTLGDGDPDLGQRVTWLEAETQVAKDSSDLAIAIADTTTWWNYADTLQGVYDAYYEPYIADYDAALAAAEADTVVTWDALQASEATGDTEQELLDKYNKFVVAYNRIINQSLTSPNFPGVATRQDTLDWVAARTAFDGLTIADLLVAGSGSAFEDLDASTDFFNTTELPADEFGGATLDAAGTQGVGGATADYLNENVEGGEAADHSEAKARLEILRAQYAAAVDEFRMLQTYIDAVYAGTEDTGEYQGNLPTADATTATNLEAYKNFVRDIQVTTEKLLIELLKKPADVVSICDQWTKINPSLDCPFSEVQDRVADVAGALNGTAKSAQAAVVTAKANLNGTTSTVGSLSNLEYAAGILGDDMIAEFVAARAALQETTQDQYDAIGTDVAAAAAALAAAQSDKAAVDKAEGDIISDIKDLFTALDVESVDNSGSNGNQAVITEMWIDIVTAVQEEVADLSTTNRDGADVTTTRDGEDYTADYEGSIQWAEDDVERATVKVALAAQDGIDAAAELEDKRAELELLQTQLSVLEAFAAELQSLLEAALAG